MSTNFPSGLDTTTTLPTEAATTALATNHVTAHANLADSVIAVETKVGIDSSADTTTLDYKLKNTASVNPGHKHTLTSSGFTDVNITAVADGNVLTYQSSSSKWINSSTSAPDASTTTKGVTKMDIAPASAASPIAVGSNNTTSGTPSGAGNAVVDAADVSSAAASGKIVRATGTALPALSGANLTGVAFPADIQTFNSGSGNWTKPTSAKKVFVQVWGGGGSGGRITGNSGGGGGGGYAERWYDASALGSTEAYAVGAGGTAANSSSAGNAGSSSTFSSSTNLVTAFGGNGGAVDASSANAVAGGTGGGNIAIASPASPVTGSSTSGGAGGAGLLSGGGGGVGSNAPGLTGGNSYSGGAGGGGSSGSQGAAAGGTSVVGGAGGAGTQTGAGIAGTAPGGGGGGTGNNTSGGAGGIGKVIVTTFF